MSIPSKIFFKSSAISPRLTEVFIPSTFDPFTRLLYLLQRFSTTGPKFLAPASLRPSSGLNPSNTG